LLASTRKTFYLQQAAATLRPPSVLMTPLLAALIALQHLDTAAEAARRRLAELPGAVEQLAAAAAAAADAVAAAKARVAENNASRRELEKQVAAVDSRLSRFDDHRAAVKTNQEYTALLHEIATAKADKDRIEEQILVAMEQADGLAAELTAAEQAQIDVTRGGSAARAALDAERQALETEIARLTTEKARAAADVEPAVLARYEQLLKQRRMVAVAAMVGETCAACYVRLRPAVAQQIRRNSDIVHCDNCQRILYYQAPAADATVAASSQP
jgi:predicted  nucleic acid-binding Zn-ribbon protein